MNWQGSGSFQLRQLQSEPVAGVPNIELGPVRPAPQTMLVANIPDVKCTSDLNRPIQIQTSYSLVSMGTTSACVHWQTPNMRTDRAAAPPVTTTSTPRLFSPQLQSGLPSFPQTASTNERSRFHGNPPLQREATQFSIRLIPWNTGVMMAWTPRPCSTTSESSSATSGSSDSRSSVDPPSSLSQLRSSVG